MICDDAPPSTLQLPPGKWSTVLACLCACFPHVAEARWVDRFARGLVQDAHGRALDVAATYRVGLEVRYWREVATEPLIPFEEQILHVDAQLVVVDKPHFLPVSPTGPWVEQTLLRRLQRRLGIPSLAPLHRLDRATAGLVLFSVEPATRAAYHALFRDHRVDKTYEALAAPLPELDFPHCRRSALTRGEPFFRVRESAAAPNSETTIDVLERGVHHWRYRLRPRTGHKHQLRVHMAALGAPIDGDPYYPELIARASDDYAHPLALLATELRFTDPTSGRARFFATQRALRAN